MKLLIEEVLSDLEVRIFFKLEVNPNTAVFIIHIFLQKHMAKFSVIFLILYFSQVTFMRFRLVSQTVDFLIAHTSEKTEKT